MDRRALATSTTVSVRMLWCFARWVGDYSQEMAIAREAGVDVATLTDPDGRIPTLVARKMLAASIEKTGDPALGVHAGEGIRSTDFGVISLAVANCPDVRQVLGCLTRYLRLADDNIEGVLVEKGDRCEWQIRNHIARPLPAVNDFQVTSALRMVTTLSNTNNPPLEVHVMHALPTDAQEYARVFRAPVRYDADCNALVLPRAILDMPIQHANVDLWPAFDGQLRTDLRRLAEQEGLKARVKRLLAKRIGRESVSLVDTARALHMSESTLRRRLSEEGTTHSDLLEELRRELAMHHVHDRRLAVGEIAFLLGFATQSAFGKAFRRWSGSSPLEYRAQIRGAVEPRTAAR